MQELFTRAAPRYGKARFSVTVPSPCNEYEKVIGWDWSFGVNPRFTKVVKAFVPAIAVDSSFYVYVADIQPVKVELISSVQGLISMTPTFRLTALGNDHQLVGTYEVVIIYKYI